MKNKLHILAFCSSLLVTTVVEAAYVSVNDLTSNFDRDNALNLNSKFDKKFDANIGKFDTNRIDSTVTNISTSFFHASVNAMTTVGEVSRRVNTATLDWYSFRTIKDDVQAYFDIDQTVGLNSRIWLYDANEVQIGFNNNHSAVDPGSIAIGTNNGRPITRDSYLAILLQNPGMYYLAVGRNANNPGLLAGQGYTLHVSLSASPVPVPAAVWLFGSGILGMVGMMRKRKASN